MHAQSDPCNACMQGLQARTLFLFHTVNKFKTSEERVAEASDTLNRSKAKKLSAFCGAECIMFTALPLYRPAQPLRATTARAASHRLAPCACLRAWELLA